MSPHDDMSPMTARPKLPLPLDRVVQEGATGPADSASEASTAKKPFYRVQIAAMESLAGARGFWASQQQAHGDLLGGLEPEFQRIERGEQELFRIQAGAFANATEAEELCDALERRDVPCLVRRP